MSRRAPHSPEFEGKKPVSAVDWLGNRFHVGEQVLYCIAAGRGQMMAIGEILAIKIEEVPCQRRVSCGGDDPDAVPYWYSTEKFFKLVTEIREDVRVQVRTLKTSGRWDNTERSKPAWVNPMNITAIRSVETS